MSLRLTLDPEQTAQKAREPQPREDLPLGNIHPQLLSAAPACKRRVVPAGAGRNGSVGGAGRSGTGSGTIGRSGPGVGSGRYGSGGSGGGTGGGVGVGANDPPHQRWCAVQDDDMEYLLPLPYPRNEAGKPERPSPGAQRGATIDG